jgi:hypothetical protein
MLVFDTATRVDATQRLLFGSYQFWVDDRCLEENLFCGDDLSQEEHQLLEGYAATHNAVSGDRTGRLRCLSRHEFAERLFRYAYRTRDILVGFNLPFDFSRAACHFGNARGRFRGGFSLGLWRFQDQTGRSRVNQFRPRICVKHLHSTHALKGFTARNEPDDVDLIPEDSETAEPEPGNIFRGHFLDLRTMAFALTDVGYSLKNACEAFAVEHGKQAVETHGVLTEEYIDYNRQDVTATRELALKLREEYDRHPIELQETKAYSPASVGKAYLRAMGIEPILKRQAEFPKTYLGYAQSAFFGGRTSAHIRKTMVPIVYTDFLSMYPTVNSLMGLWPFVIARRIDVIEHCQSDVERFLRRIRIKPADLFKPATWKRLTAFVKVIPAGDILPARAKYSSETNDWQVGVNYLHSDREALWFSLPDVVASVLLTGRIPKIVDAFRIRARGKLKGLKPTKLRGEVKIDPRRQDFFRVVIEQRKLVDRRADLSRDDKKRLSKALKVTANASSYGIFAEMNRQEEESKVNVRCFGIDEEGFTCRVAHPDVPGEFCFPPLASLITGAARLMLALLEHSVTSLGGTYAMEDTDSMGIVSTKDGGLVPCEGGTDGRAAVKALSWVQVRGIVQRFKSLNPYDRKAVPESILKIENDNFEPGTRRQRQIYCLAISAKRYALFIRSDEGDFVLLREGRNSSQDHWSKHGLGHLLNPTDIESDDRDWIAQPWIDMMLRSQRKPTKRPPLYGSPAVSRITVSSPAVMRPFTSLNVGKDYCDQIKPFNFLLTVQVSKLGHPVGADPERFHLISPYELNPKRWLKNDWIDQ